MRNNRGLSLVEVLVYLGLSSVVIFAAFSLLRTSTSMQAVSGTFNNLNDARTMILENLKNNTAFTKSLDYPQNSAVFNCIKQQRSCTGEGGPFTLLNEAGAEVLLASRHHSPSDGLNMRGEKCNTFNATNGNDDCPFSYSVHWVPRCSGDCINPIVELRATLIYRPSNDDKKLSINTAAYNIIYVKTDLTAKLNQTCEALGGTPGPGETCIQSFAGPPCGPHRFIIGFTQDGQKICKRLGGHKCPKGQVLLGVDVHGIAQCGPGCTDPVGSSSGNIW